MYCNPYCAVWLFLQETVVRYAGTDIGCVMCMGHNRGWEEEASEFSQEEVELKTVCTEL